MIIRISARRMREAQAYQAELKKQYNTLHGDSLQERQLEAAIEHNDEALKLLHLFRAR